MVTPRQALTGPSGGGLVSAPQVTPVQSNEGQQIAQMGSGLATAGAQGFRLSQGMQRDLDNANFQEASARYAELLSNTESEFNQLVGKDAHEQFDQIRRRVMTRRTELEKTLTSTNQRRAFGLDADSRQTVALNRMNARRAEQIRVHRIGAASASLDQAMRDRVNAAVKGDSTDYIRQSMTMHRKLEKLAELNNLTPEQIKLAQETAEDSVSTAAVEGLIDIGAVERADEFLNSVDGDIQDPVKRSKLQKRIQVAGVKKQADGMLPAVRQHAPGDLLQQRAFINSMDVSVEVKDELKRRAKVAMSEDRAEVAFNRTELIGQATELALRGEELPEKLQTQLEEAGILEQTRRAMTNVTTEQGEYLMETLTDDQLRAFDNPQSLINAYSHELSVADRRRLRARWDATMTEKTRLELRASEQKGGARGKSSAYAAAGEKAVVDIKIDDVINQHLTDHYARWRNLDPEGKTMSRQDVQRLRRIRNSVRRRADNIARGLGQTDLTNETVQQAVVDVLKTQTTGGYAEAGLHPDELRDADLIFKFNGVSEPVQFNVARIGLPGEHPDDSAKKRFVDTRTQLIDARVARVEQQMPGILPDRARQIAASLTSTADVYRDLARQQRNSAKAAEQAGELLDAGKPLTPEVEALAGPVQKERNNANNSVRGFWNESLTSFLAGSEEDIERDDEAFIRHWPAFRKTFGPQLREAYGTFFSTDEEAFRRETINLLFTNSSEGQRHRLWRMSGAWTPPGARSGVEGYHLPGYLRTTPEPMSFSHDLNGHQKQ